MKDQETPRSNKRRRTDCLDPRPDRSRHASPVSAPLIERAASRAAQRASRRASDAAAPLWQEYLRTHSVEARNALWTHYQRLVRFVAEHQKSKLPEYISVHELVSAGNNGLLDALLKFDPARGVRFETYCVPRVRGAMLDAIRTMDWVPRLVRSKAHQLERLVAGLAAELGREPSDDEVAERLQLSPEQFAKLRKELAAKSLIAFDNGDPGAPCDLPRLEMLEDPEPYNPTRNLQLQEVRELAVRGLNSNERTVVEHYYFGGRSMKDIGEELHLSESRICQIHAQVLALLRSKFEGYETI